MIGLTRFRLTTEINAQAKLAAQVARAQADISSGKRLQVPSDDPLASQRVSNIGKTQMNETTWTTNVQLATAISNQADTVLAGVANSVQRANELMLRANNDTLNENDRAAIAIELQGIADDIDAASLTKDSRGVPLFSPDTSLAIPISETVTIAASADKTMTFDQVATSPTPMSLGDIVRQAATAITVTDPAQRRVDSTAALAATQVAIDHVAAARADQGSRASRIEMVTEQLATSELQLKEERSNLEDTDLPATVATMQAQLLSLQAAQSVFAKISQNSLFDYIR